MGFFDSMINGLGKSLKPSRLSSLDPTQQNMFDLYARALTGEGGPLADIFGFDAEGLRDMFQESYAAPAYQQFQEEVIPGITGQFRGGNLQNSSYLGGALGKAGTDVQNNLNQQLSQMMYQAQQASLDRRQKGLQDILGTQTFAYQSSPIMQLLQALAGGAGKAAGAKMGGM